MTNIINDEVRAAEHLNGSAHLVESGYFRERLNHLESLYRDQYPGGWGQFFAEYSNGNTDEENLDYDEWAFLCEHFMRELTQSWHPPGVCGETQEKPETVSGFSILGYTHCLIQINISRTSSGQSTALSVGRAQDVRNR